MIKFSLNLKSFLSFQKLIFWVSFLTFLPFGTGLLGKTGLLVAQVDLPTCQAPIAGEFLVLVNTPTVESQERLRNSVPSEMNRIICKYNGEAVTRLGGLSSIDEADRWGQYVIEIVGLSAVIARPSQSVRTPVVDPPPSNNPPPTTIVPTTNTTPSTIAYNPQSLGQGYAVLVNYFNRPEVAGQLRDFLVKDVGLVAYLSRPYLLALQTNNLTTANQLLSRLSRQGFWAVVVDSQGVMLLSPTVRY